MMSDSNSVNGRGETRGVLGRAHTLDTTMAADASVPAAREVQDDK